MEQAVHKARERRNEMCLCRVLMRFTKADEVEGIGWKVFKSDSGRLMPEYKGWMERPTGQWLHERNFRSEDDFRKIRTSEDYKYYPIGWHIFGSRSTAYKYASDRKGNGVCSSYVARRVKYRDARTVGTQARKRIIVAKEMYIFGQYERAE